MAAAEGSTGRPAPAPLLGDVIARAGPDLLAVHRNGAARVGSVILCEPDAARRIPPDALVLAVGYGAEDPRLARLVEDAAGAHAAGVIARPSSVTEQEFQRLGARHEISTIFAAPQVDWLAIAALLRGAGAGSTVDAVGGTRVGDLFAFANAVALAAGGATAIVDPAGQILAFSTLPNQPLDALRRRTTLLMEELDAPATDPDYQRVYATNGCVLIPGRRGVYDRVAIAVRSQYEILGSIWVLVPERTSQIRAEEALRQFVEPAALHLHHARADLDLEQTRRALLLETVVKDGRRAAGAVASLGLDGDSWFRLGIVITDRPSDGMIRRQLQGVTNWVRIAHRRAVCAELDSQLVILFSGNDTPRWSETERSLRGFFGSSGPSRAALAIATSLPVIRAQDLSAEFDRLGTLARLPDLRPEVATRPIISMEQYWPRVELATLAADYPGHDAGRLAVLDAIRQSDREHDTAYWPTLRAYVQANRSHNEAAARLHIHANTVRYRIERIAKLFGLDVGQADLFAWVLIQTYRP